MVRWFLRKSSSLGRDQTPEVHGMAKVPKNKREEAWKQVKIFLRIKTIKAGRLKKEPAEDLKADSNVRDLNNSQEP